MLGSKGARVVKSALKSSSRYVSTTKPFNVKLGSAEDRVATDLFTCAVAKEVGSSLKHKEQLGPNRNYKIFMKRALDTAQMFRISDDSIRKALNDKVQKHSAGLNFATDTMTDFSNRRSAIIKGGGREL